MRTRAALAVRLPPRYLFKVARVLPAPTRLRTALLSWLSRMGADLLKKKKKHVGRSPGPGEVPAASGVSQPPGPQRIKYEPFLSGLRAREAP